MVLLVVSVCTSLPTVLAVTVSHPGSSVSASAYSPTELSAFRAGVC